MARLLLWAARAAHSSETGESPGERRMPAPGWATGGSPDRRCAKAGGEAVCLMVPRPGWVTGGVLAHRCTGAGHAPLEWKARGRGTAAELSDGSGDSEWRAAVKAERVESEVFESRCK